MLSGIMKLSTTTENSVTSPSSALFRSSICPITTTGIRRSGGHGPRTGRASNHVLSACRPFVTSRSAFCTMKLGILRTNSIAFLLRPCRHVFQQVLHCECCELVHCRSRHILFPPRFDERRPLYVPPN